MQVNSVNNSNPPSFTALRLSPASKRYLDTLSVEELVTLRRAGNKMKSYKFWDLEIAGFGPVVRNRQKQHQVINDFRSGRIFTNCPDVVDANTNTNEILQLVDTQKTPLQKALELVKYLEFQSRSATKGYKNINQHSSKKELINAMMEDFSAV